MPQSPDLGVCVNGRIVLLWSVLDLKSISTRDRLDIISFPSVKFSQWVEISLTLTRVGSFPVVRVASSTSLATAGSARGTAATMAARLVMSTMSFMAVMVLTVAQVLLGFRNLVLDVEILSV